MSYRPVTAPPSRAPMMMQFTQPSGGGTKSQVVHQGVDALLLRFEGSNGSTTFTDSSNFGRTVTPANDAQIGTGRFKFGAASGLFGGTGYLTVPYSELWTPPTNVDLTLDMFIYPTSVGGGTIRVLAGSRKQVSGTTTAGYVFQLTTTGVLSMGGWSGPNTTAVSIAGTTVVPTSAWSHVAMTRKAGVWRLYLNGALEATSGVITNLAEGDALVVGRDPTGPGRELIGNIDSLRFRAGEALYTGSTYTVPTSEFQLP